ncbi:6-O-methylguanine DNA methyltransferase [Geothermobacter hydrogeniphilus]|uniref:methylated-DNA--[protein]-cysteine S-methyltransferase n=1 Tax=Geothermobacter hydrogeniphilus TaxID=1969733 RepID=A0A2K2H8Z1_9BACT|nr:bifunctional helix-turn-helix domain-containing protein/methylated-DNA--[protein]-cysteine S-methyltransferase [Geothermobacter hydrogeniphilus]PNU19699.1 6-O-methylguanine DNA methyltransferase [Geothermobacter hydrogeniphilus]
MDHPDYQHIAQAIRFLEDHASEQPSLETVAAHIGFSPFHFQRLFKSWAGVSPKRFLQYLTVEHAKQMLRASESVLETAFEVGLSGPGRLHDLFVSVEAVTPGEYKSFGRDLQLFYGFHSTPFGDCLLAASTRGICALSFVEDGRRQAIEELRSEWRQSELAEDTERTGLLVDRIFAAPDREQDEPLRLLLKGTNFQLKVWEALLKIPEGRVVSYGTLARAVGHRGAHRAVGTAVGHNPIACLIPCHRVLRSSGGIGGYRWGTTRKRAMLAREAALTQIAPA